MPKIKTTPTKTEAPEAPKQEKPTVSIDEILKTLDPIASKLGEAEGEAKIALMKAAEFKADLVIAIQDLAEKGAKRDDLKEAVIQEVAKIYSKDVALIRIPAKDGGYGSGYVLVSEIMNVAFPRKSDNKEPVKKGLKDGKSWDELKNLARHGFLTNPNSAKHSKPEPLTIKTAVDKFRALLLKVNEAGLDVNEFKANCDAHFAVFLGELEEQKENESNEETQDGEE